MNETIAMRRNPYFIGILSAIEGCRLCGIPCRCVAILILLESFLQYIDRFINEINESRRNPYFIGILSAI